MANKIQIRRDVAANWTSSNPTLSQGEQGYETDTGKIKIGDGSTAWTSLAYNTSYSDSDVDTHLNTSTATTGEVLSWSGTDYDWIAGGGGAALELYAENPSTPTAPSATGSNAVAIGSQSQASGSYGLALGRSSNSSGQGGVAIGYAIASGSRSVSINNAAGSYSTVASASNSTAIGGNSSGSQGSQAVTGSGAMALGGSYASGTDSFAAAIANNSSSYGATGTSSVAIGYLSKASNTDAVAIGDTATASGTNSFAHGRSSIANSADAVAIGIGATTTASRAFSFGDNCISSASYSFSIGRSTKSSYNYSYAFGYNTEATRKGVLVFGGGQFGSRGDAQCGIMVLRRATTDATSTVLTSDGSTPAGINEVQLPNNSAYAFHGTIVARQQASQGTACAAWKVEGLIRREGSAGTTVLVNSATTVLDNTPNWGMALSADTTNGGLAITVTGAAATNIRWVATIHTSEVTYA